MQHREYLLPVGDCLHIGRDPQDVALRVPVPPSGQSLVPLVAP